MTQDQSFERFGDAPGLEGTANRRARRDISEFGQIVLVLQGGGALGAYQVGVYQAMHEAGVEPDWVIGTSIGAINAALIAGNKPENRIDRLKEFWKRVEYDAGVETIRALPFVGRNLTNWMTLTNGVSSFFTPNPSAYFGLDAPVSTEAAGYYSTKPLEATLTELVDFSLIGSGPTRLTVGAANLRTAEMKYFDARDIRLGLRHVMASGALPPAFPAIQIDGEFFWDGGILSNTPVEAVFDENPRRNSLVFAVQIWNPNGPPPETMRHVMGRHKDIQYSSRVISHIKRQKQIHRLRHIIAELAMRLPEEERQSNVVREMASYGCLTRMHIMRLLAPALEDEDHSKDIDFSRKGIECRWKAGYEDARRVLADAPWEGEVDPIEGFYLHECPSRTAPMK